MQGPLPKGSAAGLTRKESRLTKGINAAASNAHRGPAMIRRREAVPMSDSHRMGDRRRGARSRVLEVSHGVTPPDRMGPDVPQGSAKHLLTAYVAPCFQATRDGRYRCHSQIEDVDELRLPRNAYVFVLSRLTRTALTSSGMRNAVPITLSTAQTKNTAPTLSTSATYPRAVAENDPTPKAQKK